MLRRIFDEVGCRLLGRMFVGGRSIEDVLKTGERLKKEGYKVTYNLLGEHQGDSVFVDYALRTTLELIGKMSERNQGNVAIKPSLYGLQISPDSFLANAKFIVERAKSQGISVEFDAEQQSFTNDTFKVFNFFASRMEYRGFVAQCVQAHARNIMSVMTKYGLWNKRIRVVKGAGVYKENADRVIGDEKDILVRYKQIAILNRDNWQAPLIATVRDRTLAYEMAKIFRNPNTFEFEMLYGPIGKRLSRELLEKGYSVRIYIPFTDIWCKDAWIEYRIRRSAMMRRLALGEVKRIIGKVFFRHHDSFENN